MASKLPALVLAAFFCFSSSGCLSSSYTVSQQELARLTQLPPEDRGKRVHVVQQVGGPDGFDVVAGSGEGALIVLAAVIAFTVLGLTVAEGLRYDGAVEVFQGMPVLLVDAQRKREVIPLSELQPAQVAQAARAEFEPFADWPPRRLERRPLDRKGFAFKMDMGSVQSFCATCYSAVGFAGDLQLGYFPHHRAGVLATASLDRGVYSLGRTFERHTFGLEAQLFPLNLWRFHLGGFGHAGWQIGKKEGDEYRTGPAFGGGAILEFALTTRMAAMARADWTKAKNAPEGGWVTSQIFTAGLAIY